MLLWAVNRPEREALVVPEGVRVESIPAEPLRDPGLDQVQVLVPRYGSQTVLEALPQMPSLQLIQTLESGVDWLLPSVPPGVTLCNCRGAHDSAVAEWVLGAVLAMQRRLPEHLDAQRRAEWRDVVSSRGWLPPYAGDLEGASVLIVGFGSIGEAVEKRLLPFGVDVQRVARTARPGVSDPSALPQLVAAADIVILLLPLTAETTGLFDAELIGAMKPGALLVNAGRGQVVEKQPLLEALERGRLRAALDVTDPEPLPPDDPLWSAPNLLLTPHIAGDTPRRFRHSWHFVGEQVSRLRNGLPLENVVR
ncbi:MAG TPA: NAD(P)-dependent oxidoreductase [Solirubrobacterales bacterium]|nr:NAD(P)-dependent oxidoreductase [Solirubrobacterales bacterium]